MYFGLMVCRLISRRDCVIIIVAVVVCIPSLHTHSYLGVLGFPLPSIPALLFQVEGGPISACGQLGLWNHRERKDSPCHRQNSWPQSFSSYSHRHSASYEPQPRQLSMTTFFQTCLRTWFCAMCRLLSFTWLEIYLYTVSTPLGDKLFPAPDPEPYLALFLFFFPLLFVVYGHIYLILEHKFIFLF